MTPARTPEPRFIDRVRVDKLFGQYSYDFRRFAPANTASGSRLAILYGDNGSGKTTILRLAFHLLSHLDSRGHRSFLGRTPFKRFELTLGGVVVGAERTTDRLVGPYTLYMKRGRRDYSVDVKTDPEDHSVTKASATLRPFLKRLAALDVSLFYITDERELLTNFEFRTTPKEEELARRRKLISTSNIIFADVAQPRPAVHHIDAALTEALQNALEWSKEQVLSGSKQGEADTNTVYTQIVRRLTAGSEDEEDSGGASDIASLISALESQRSRSAEFAKYGLPSALNIQDLTEALTHVRQNPDPILRIVRPYVEGIRARLDALQAIQRSLATLVATLNGFLVDKEVSFDLNKGITLASPNGSRLDPAALSSGEKQLLLLFCNTFVARTNTTIFLIDEPELSLNIKWQRKLIGALSATTGRRNIQFLMATHSFELFSPHSESVWHLTANVPHGYEKRDAAEANA